MREWALLVVVAAGCGRIGFDAGSGDGGGTIDTRVSDAPGFTGTHTAYIKADTPGMADQFGAGVALSADGTTLAVGAYGATTSAGAVYVYTRANDAWTQQARLVPAIADANDNFGVAVSLSADGNTLAIAAFLEDSGVVTDPSDNGADGAGAAYVFVRSGTTWSEQAYLKASNVEMGDQLGQSIALSGDGNTLAVGAHYEASGVPGNPADNSAGQAGAVYVFTRAGPTWSQTGYVKAANAGGGDSLGESLDISADGALIVAGAYLESSAAINVDGDGSNDFVVNSGAAYVFEAPAWTQRAYIKAFNTDMSDEFGVTVAIAIDGTVVVGSHLEASGQAGNQTDNSLMQAGAAYVYSRGVTAWEPGAYLKASPPQFNGLFALRVALSDAGSTLAIGAVGENASTGAAYVFVRTAGVWQSVAHLTPPNGDPGDSFGSVALSGDGTTLAVGAYLEDSNGNPSDNSSADSGAVYVFW